jgi:septum formation inhibitor MinC
MTKIAIISQAEQGVLIDISGCSSLVEAKQYLTSTLQVSSQFWEGLIVDLNLGPLVLTPEQVNEIQAIVSEVGVQPRQIFSLSPITRASLLQCRLPLGMLAQLQGYALMTPLEELQENPLTASHNEPVNQAVHILSGLENAALTANASSNQSSNPGSNPVLNSASARASLATEDASSILQTSADFAIPSAYYAAGSSSSQLSGSNRNEPGYSDEAPQTVLPELGLGATANFTFLEHNFAAESNAVPGSRLSMPNHHVSKTIAQNSVPTTGNASQRNQSAESANQAAQNRQASPAVLMMKQTLRSGQSVTHRGHLVIIGDVNPGAELVADGDITVWGALRGVAHAGASGNSNAEIRALKFDAIQLRIANAIARSPDRNKAGSSAPAVPETARVIDGKIRLSVSDPE